MFVVDELDKLEHADVQVGQLIMRLKHLVSDYGLFCFLTDREYYEYVLNKVQTEPYPREHTYFSHWLFVQYQPRDLLRYINSLLIPPATGSPSEIAADQLDARILARFALHRARLNNIDVLRVLASHFDPFGSLLPSEAGLRARLNYQSRLAIQLAIEHLFAHPPLRQRVESDARFAQLVVDTLYAPSRVWEGDSAAFAETPEPRTEKKPLGPAFVFNRDRLLAYLCDRMVAKVPGTKGGDAAADHSRIKADDVDLLLEQLRNLMILLGDLEALRLRLEQSQNLDTLDRPALDAIPITSMPRLWRRSKAGKTPIAFCSMRSDVNFHKCIFWGWETLFPRTSEMK